MALPIVKLPRRIHLVGVGGDGMSALAHYLADSGHQVSGSDLHSSIALKGLSDRGIEVAIGHDINHLKTIECVVISDAIPNTNIEVVEARLRDLPILTRSQCIAFLAKEKEGIFVGGSHGKSTTSGILAHLLCKWDSSTSFLLGASISSLDNCNAQSHVGRYMVAEACEAFGNLQYLFPDHLVLTNIDDEHLNHYGSQSRLDYSFAQLFERTSHNGTIVFNGDDPGISRILSSLSQKSHGNDCSNLISVGFKSCNQVQIVRYQWSYSYAEFDLVLKDQVLIHLRLKLPGLHNALNAALAVVMAHKLGIPTDALQKSLESFHGLERRWQDYGYVNGIHLIDDYAHHPAELDALFDSANQVLGNNARKILIYQPQLISRTNRVLHKTAQSLARWDEILLLEIDSAGESNPDNFNIAVLGDLVSKNGGSVKFFENSEDVINRIDRYVSSGDAVIVAGAGQIRSLASNLKFNFLNSLEQKSFIDQSSRSKKKKNISHKNIGLLYSIAKHISNFGLWIMWYLESKYFSASVVDLYKWNLNHRPDDIVVITPRCQYTYRQLDTYANMLAIQFKEGGVSSGDVVGVHLGSSVDLVASILAIAKLGAVYLPLDTKLPIHRLEKQMSLSKSHYLVSNHNFKDSLDLLKSISFLKVDTSKELDFLHNNLEKVFALSMTNIHPSDLAYVCFTSGTTGIPKGVPISHGSLHNLVVQLISYLSFSKSSRILVNTGIGFDVSLAELWLGLTGGGAMIVTNEEHTLVGPRLGDFIEEMNVTHIAVTPTILRSVPKRIYSSLRYVILAGEICTPELVNQWSSTTRYVFNAYGPTEATIYTSISYCKPNKKITIGKPLRGIKAYVVNDQNQELMAGYTGELLIGGKGVSPGYISGENKQHSAFFSWIRNGEAVDWVYRTGDLVMKNIWGEMIYLGRKDTQIKLNGVRIEVEEIEEVLRLQAEIADAVVALDTSSNLEYLVAFLLPQSENDIDLTMLRNKLMQLLPGAMVPSQYVVVKNIPRTLNGKVDRQDLLDKRRSLTVVRPFFDAGRSDIERDLVRIWERVLQFEPIGIYDEFFTLGGDSLRLLLLQDEIESTFNIQLPPAFLGDLRNITNLAVKLDELISLQDVIPIKSETLFEQSRIYKEISKYTFNWNGVRNYPNSLIVSLGDGLADHDLFICLQYEKEVAELHEALGQNYRVHGMRSGHLVMTYTPENIALLADRYCEEILSLMSSRKMIIAGICQGGTIAHAIATKLSEYIKTPLPLVLIEQARFPKYCGKTHFYYSKDSFLNPINKFKGDLSRLDEIYGDSYTFDEVLGTHGTITHKPYVYEFVEKLNKQLLY